MSTPDAEDVKLLTLARAARARAGSAGAAAVRDLDGRTYSATPVQLASLRLTALQLAVAMALSSGAAGLEAAVVVGAADPAGVAAVTDVTPAAAIYAGNDDGTLSRLEA